MTTPAITETLLDNADLDDVSDVEELFSALASSATPPPEGEPVPAAEPPPSPAPTTDAPPASPAPPSAEPTPPEPASTPASVPAAAPATVAPPPPAPVAPAPVAAPVAAAPQPAPAPVNLPELLEKQLRELAGQYALAEDDARAMLTEPEVVLPKLAAKMHQQMLSAVQQTLVSQLPQLIHNVTEARLVEAEAQNRFFTRWPQLRQHSDAVIRVGQMYRAANPKASPEEAVEQIGKICAMSLGVPEGTTSAPPPPAQPAPAPMAPHRPAAAGGTPIVTKPADPNTWASFADDDIRSNA